MLAEIAFLLLVEDPGIEPGRAPQVRIPLVVRMGR